MSNSTWRTIAYGHGGWVQIDYGDGAPLVYVRFALVGGAPRVVELYVDAQGSPIDSDLVDAHRLNDLSRAVLSDGLMGWLESSVRLAGPDLSRLAASFSTSWGGFHGRTCAACGGPVRHFAPAEDGTERAFTNWLALSWWSQIKGSGVEQPPRPGRRKSRTRSLEAPPALTAPERLSDDFLELVARHYAWAAVTRQRPAPMMAEQAHVSPRTVHSWIAKARDRGFIAPATRRRNSDV